MANDLTTLIPEIKAQILPVLREQSVMPRVVNTSYSADAAARGSTIDVEDVEDMTAYDITPGDAPASGVKSDVASTQKTITLNKFKAVTFDLTDKEIYEIMNGTRTRAIEKAVKALAKQVNTDIFDAAYKGFYNYTGTAGTTPFNASTVEAQTARKILRENEATMDECRMVLDVDAYANALGLDVLQKVNESGDNEALREGMITRAVGFDWYEDQQVPTHTSTAAGTYAIDADATAGATSLVLDDDAGADVTTPAVGDIFNIAGDTTNYVVTSVTVDTPTANETTVGISPKLAADVTDGDNVTFVTTAAAGAAVQNLAFERTAIGFASRPMLDLETPGSTISVLSDPVSQLSMRFEIQRLWKKTIMSVDMLYGVSVVRPELGVRVFG